MEIIVGILAAFLQFNFFSILFFAGICYAFYYDIFTALMGMAPEFSFIFTRMLPPLGTGLDGIPVFGIYLFFIIFVLLIVYHVITYWQFWATVGVILLVTLFFQLVSGMGGFAPFTKFILSIIGIILGLIVAFILLLATFLISLEKYNDWKYEKQLQSRG